MSRKSELNANNPICEVRLQHHKTLMEFAAEAGIHFQALYLNECGCYPTILPALMALMTRKYQQDKLTLQNKYDMFVIKKRMEFADKHKPYAWPEVDVSRSPVEMFRKALGYSQIGFAKAICIQPTILYKVERGKSINIPESIKHAFKILQIPYEMVEEFNYRQQEFSNERS
jgi:DNA-binding XRE family transcriptional regulator